MSIAKTLIQKEIERQKRSMKIDKDEIKRLKKLRRKPGKEDHATIDQYIESHEKRTAASKPIVKELEKDLKKL